MDENTKWQRGCPPQDGKYLVQVSWMGKPFIVEDTYEEPIGFVEFHDNVIAWAPMERGAKE